VWTAGYFGILLGFGGGGILAPLKEFPLGFYGQFTLALDLLF
jgi:hypothetical protein